MRAAALAVVVALCAAPAAARADDGDRLIEWYGKRSHWRAVRKEVLGWHKTTRNACVAFVSTALRRVGVDVPLDAEVDGERVSRLTRPFSLWLTDHLGWTRIDSAADLEPGDIVFTERAEYPWHVFVFHSWSDEASLEARVLDNHGFLTRRPILGDATGTDDVDSGGGITPFAYALRAP